MESNASAPRFALIMNLAEIHAQQPTVECIRALVPTLLSLDLPATWILGAHGQTSLLGPKVLASELHEFGTTVSDCSPRQLSTDLASGEAAIRAATGRAATTVMGDSQQLRTRAALLSKAGIATVVSDDATSATEATLRPFPCGIWQLNPVASLPRTRRRWSVLRPRKMNLSKLLASGSGSCTLAVRIDLAALDSRQLPDCLHLLQQLANGVRGRQLALVRCSELAAEATANNGTKPQRSILRAA